MRCLPHGFGAYTGVYALRLEPYGAKEARSYSKYAVRVQLSLNTIRPTSIGISVRFCSLADRFAPRHQRPR